MEIKDSLTIIEPVCSGRNNGSRIRHILYPRYSRHRIQTADVFSLYLSKNEQMTKKRILFFVCLDNTGINLELCRMLRVLAEHPGCMEGSVGGILMDGSTEDATKLWGRILADEMNRAGCCLVGRPLAEGTGSLKNYLSTAQREQCTLSEAYEREAEDMVRRLQSFQFSRFKTPQLLCLHSCNEKTSNTLQLWHMVKARLEDKISVTELSLKGRELHDCSGCLFSTCIYYGQRSGCCHQDFITEKVYPQLARCNALVLLCPNYNDAAGADLTAVINRMTSLYRRKPFSDKYLFSLVVSGYSGGDIVEQQLIDALNMNKSFILPGHFSLRVTANHPGSLMQIEGISERAADFAGHIVGTLLKN